MPFVSQLQKKKHSKVTHGNPAELMFHDRQIRVQRSSKDT